MEEPRQSTTLAVLAAVDREDVPALDALLSECHAAASFDECAEWDGRVLAPIHLAARRLA